MSRLTSSNVPQTITYSKTGPVARIVLDRPDVINAYNVQMRDDLYGAMEAVRDDPEVRVAVLSGAGDRGFCAGADLTEFGTAPSQVIARDVRWERDVWGLFLSLEKPLVAALHGWVVGSGIEIACLCDIRIASEDAVFRMPEVALGMLPAAGGTQTLPRIVGVDRALRMLLECGPVGAVEARRLGLVHTVVHSRVACRRRLRGSRPSWPNATPPYWPPPRRRSAGGWMCLWKEVWRSRSG